MADFIPFAEQFNNGGQTLAATPWTSQTDIDRSNFGVASVADGLTSTTTPFEFPTVRFQRCENWFGTGIVTGSGNGRVTDCLSGNNFVGCKLSSSDSGAAGNFFFNNRDVGLWISGVGGSSNCQSMQNHCFGARVACYNEGSGAFRALNDTYADAFIGYYGGIVGGGSNQGVLTNVLTQHNLIRDIVFRASGCGMVNCVVNIQKAVSDWTDINIETHNGNSVHDIVRSIDGADEAKVGVELGDRCYIRGGTVEFEDYYLVGVHTPSGDPCEGIWVTGGSSLVTIETNIIDNHAIDGAVATRLKSSAFTPIKGVYIDCPTYGFHQNNSRLLAVDSGSHADGLDITYRLDYMAKPASGYVDIGSGWTGSIRLIDESTGEETSLHEGRAY
jgi:hypothetical protein